jgi:hypothetical protein
MLRKIIFNAIIFIIFISNLFSAFENKPISATSAALAGMKTTIDDEALAVFYNPTLVPKTYSINTFYTNFLGISELDFGALAISLPFFRGSFGIGYSNFGDIDFYNEKMINFSYGFSITDYLKLGFSYKNFYLDLGEMGQKTNIYAIDFGAKIDCSDKIDIGILFSNLNRPKIGKYHREEIYHDYNFGVKYSILSNLNIYYEIFKENKYEIDHKFGSQIKIFEKFLIRFGLQKNIDTFNLGFSIKNFLDYAYTYHFDLGSQHFFNLKFYFKSNKN